MTKREIRTLAMGSYTKNILDSKKVRQISKLLKLVDLRLYVKELKRIEAKKVVKVIVPNKKFIASSLLNKIKLSFKGKRIIIEEDPSLILGIKIVDNDLIYDLNLKNTLENLNKYMVEQYDK